jgi:hypothetical protein
LSLVTWEKEGLSVLQVTKTWRAKLTCVIWDCHNCAAENAVKWVVTFCHLVCSSWHLQGTTLLQNVRQYPPSLSVPHSKGTASSNMTWFYATCDAYVV